MTDSRWLNELSKTYIAESVEPSVEPPVEPPVEPSVETPMSLMEQQLQEHEDYISTLETMLALVVEEFDIDVESLVEAAKKPMPKKPMPKKPMASKPSAAALRYLKLSKTGASVAERGTGGNKSAVAARTAALKKLEQVASTAAGRNALKRFG